MDEIGNIPLEFQAKLLRVLENGEFLQLGTDTSRKVDIRFISATNMNLDALMAKGLFRNDFYYRLNGAWLHLPPLRNRRKDIPLLTYYFLNEFSGSKGKVTINDKALAMIGEYNYPGNIRELKSILHAAFNLARGGAITAACLPAHLQKVKFAKSSKNENVDHSILPLREVEKGHIMKVYVSTGNNKSQTAKLLGIGLNTLRRKLQSYGVN
jgi:transcriptional regulator with PAS, ATPase and Fis domain